MGPDAMHIVGIGAATPIGRDWASSCAAQRAGIAGFTAHPFLTDARGEAVRVAPAPWLSWSLGCEQRLASLLVESIEEALHAFAPRLGDLRVGLTLALPAPRPGLPTDIVGEVHQTLRARLPRSIELLGTCALGHAGGCTAFIAAAQALRERRVELCVCAGAESWLEPETLSWLEAGDRLHSAGELNNAWGRVPGEAGAAIVLCQPDALTRWGAPPLARIVALGVGHEPQIDDSDVCIGVGLTNAFEGALSALPADCQIDDLYGDMNGERYRAAEFAFTALRFSERLRSASDYVAAADTWGDVGAASVPLNTACAVMAGLKSYSTGPWALVWASSDGHDRGAALIDRRRLEA